MNFTEVRTEVLAITGRPDKVALAGLAINDVVSYCTLTGEFRDDIIEDTLLIDSTLYGDTLALTGDNLLTRFRRFLYVKPTGEEYYLTPISCDTLFIPGVGTRRDTYHVLGTNLIYTLSRLADSLEVGYLSYAKTLDTGTNNTHWMLTAIPHAIIRLAASKVFMDIGDENSARSFAVSGMEMFNVFRRDHALGA